MTNNMIVSMLFLQASTAGPVGVAAHADPGALSLMSFSVDFLIHAIVIGIALIVICAIVFTYRRRGKDEKRGFTDTYQRELDAMRKGPSGQKDKSS